MQKGNIDALLIHVGLNNIKLVLDKDRNIEYIAANADGAKFLNEKGVQIPPLGTENLDLWNQNHAMNQHTYVCPFFMLTEIFGPDLVGKLEDYKRQPTHVVDTTHHQGQAVATKSSAKNL